MTKLFCLLFGALSLTACHLNAQPSVPFTTDARVEAVRCPTINFETGKFGVQFGSRVRLGDAIVSAHHVTDGCYETPIESPQGDWSVIELGDPGICRNASHGEPVRFIGYPVFDSEGVGRFRDGKLPQEHADGAVITTDFEAPFFNGKTREYEVVSGLTQAAPVDIRGGYSGGAVISLIDNRIVGVISSSDSSIPSGFFAPVEDICDAIKELTDE